MGCHFHFVDVVEGDVSVWLGLGNIESLPWGSRVAMTVPGFGNELTRNQPYGIVTGMVFRGHQPWRCIHIFLYISPGGHSILIPWLSNQETRPSDSIAEALRTNLAELKAATEKPALSAWVCSVV